jgi:molybdopterin molybdotransferase
MAELISIAQAREHVLDATVPLGTERVAIKDALDRILAVPVHARGDLPPFTSSAMDGYATSPGPAGRLLQICGESRAGHPYEGGLAPGCAVRISTGALVPADAQAVIRQEDTEPAGEGAIRTTAALAPGANLRPAGEELRSGAIVLQAGVRLGAGELGAAVSAGHGELSVARQPQVAVLCTGDELRAPGEPLAPGQIHNSNAVMLMAMAQRCGAIAQPAARLPDDQRATAQALEDAIRRAEVVIVTGGVSVGPHDHVKPALAALGARERFWGVRLQPGKPTWFGTSERKLIFGLPGNPVSSAVTFSLFVAPALRALQGMTRAPLAFGEALLASPVRRNPAREQALRVRLQSDGGTLRAHPFPRQESHIISSLVGVDALALLAPGEGEAPAGERIALAEIVR